MFTYYVDSLMTLPTFSDADVIAVDDATASSLDLMSKNTLTTCGLAVAAGTAVAGTAVLVAALPAQMATAAALSGGLIYAGDRQAKGLPILPKFQPQGPAAPKLDDNYDHTAGVEVQA